MIYRAKKDPVFTVLLSCFGMVLSGLVLTPMLVLPSFNNTHTIVLLIAVWCVLVASLLWCATTIQYEFRKNMFYAKRGPFTKKIPYRQITNIEMCTFSVSDLALGNCTFASKDGIVITHQNGTEMIKVSPQDKHLFTAELQKQIRIAKTM